MMILNCKICGSKLVKESWVNHNEGWVGDVRCPARTYEYYNCYGCGMRYSLQEAEKETNEIDAI